MPTARYAEIFASLSALLVQPDGVGDREALERAILKCWMTFA
jgi:hypothetical protein